MSPQESDEDKSGTSNLVVDEVSQGPGSSHSDFTGLVWAQSRQWVIWESWGPCVPSVEWLGWGCYGAMVGKPGHPQADLSIA